MNIIFTKKTKQEKAVGMRDLETGMTEMAIADPNYR